MLRTRNDQLTLWDAILPEELLELPELLAKVDRLLDDERFFAPFRAHFHPAEGRPSIPIETYLRLMFLKHRYGLGYEPLCREVADSITWQRFCRIPLGTSVVRHDDYIDDLPQALRIVAILPTADEADAEVERLNALRKGRYFALAGKYFPEGRDVQVGY